MPPPEEKSFVLHFFSDSFHITTSGHQILVDFKITFPFSSMISSGMWLSGKCFLILEVTFAFFCVIKFVVVFVNDEEDDDSWWHALARWS